MEKVIRKVVISKNFGGDRTVTVTDSEGNNKDIFNYYPDEITIVPTVLIGMTFDEAKQYKRNLDIEYLQR